MRKTLPMWVGAAGAVIGAALLLGRIGLASSPALFGTGRNPTLALSVTADGGADGGNVTSVNAYAALTQTAPSGTTTLVVDNASIFSAGSTAMIWQTTGLTNPGLDAGWQAEAGTPLNFDLTNNQVGNYEWVLIASTNNTTNTLTLSAPLTSAYGGYAGGYSQVITVPAFTTVTVNPGAVLAPAQPWNGVKGGVLVFTAQSVVNNGTIRADGYGFRGGVLRNQGAGLQNPNGGAQPGYYGCAGLNGWVGVGSTVGGVISLDAGGAHKGENIVPSWYNELADGGTTYTNAAVSPSDPTFFSYGYGNMANGGGGGNCHNAGGGGGGNGSPGGNGSLSFSGDSPGSRAVGGIGGSALTYGTADHLSFGGGGGAGDENNFVGTAGGNGGGIIYIQAGTISGTGVFSANGTTPPLTVAPYSATVGTNVAGNDGAGGGGAGGVVVLRATATACGSASANGGAGGNVSGGNANSGQGGPGGTGRVDIQPTGSCTTVLAPGALGYETSVGVSATGGATVVALDAGNVPAANLVVSTSPGGATYDASACTLAQIAAGFCGGCESNTDCTVTPTTPVCNTTTAICVACVLDSDCTATPATPYCNDGNNAGAAVTFQCVGCLTTAECQVDGGVNVCQASTNTCVSPTSVGDGGTSDLPDSGTDGGSSRDGGGGGGTSDAGSADDGGTSGGTPSKSGCSCRVGDSSSSGSTQASLVLALAGLAAFLRIRRPRRASK